MLRTTSFVAAFVLSVFLFSFQSFAQLPTATLSGSQTNCALVAANLTVTFTGTGPWNFSYSDGSATYTIITNENPYTITVNPITTTTYTPVSISDLNSIGTINGNAIVTIKSLVNNSTTILPINILNLDPVNCSLGKTELQTLAGYPFYIWVKDNNLIHGINSNTLDITSLGGGNYAVAAIDTNCTTISSAVTNIFLDPFRGKPIITGDNTIQCGSPNTILTATEGFLKYDWMLNNTIVQSGTTNKIIANTFGAGNYTVKTYDANGCTNLSLNFNVTEIKPIINNAVSSNSLFPTIRCQSGNNILIAQTGFDKYDWMLNDVLIKSGTDNTIDASDFGPGNYSFKTYLEGCTSTSLDYPINFISEKSIPNITASANAICPGQTINLVCDQFNGTYSKYNWSNGATNYSTIIIQPGTYTLNVTDISGCNYTNSITITQPTIFNNSNISCTGSLRTCNINESILIQSSISLSNYYYNWIKNGEVYSTNTSGFMNAHETGSYSLDIIPSPTTTPSFCFNRSNSIDILITNPPIPAINYGCGPASQYLYTVSGAINNQVYKWYNDINGTTLLYTSSSSIDNTYYSSLQSVYVSIYDQISGCETSLSNMYYILDSVKLSDQTISICADGGATTTLTTDVYTGGLYRWYNVSNGGTPIYTSSSNIYVMPKLTQNTSFYVDYLSSRGCLTTMRAVINVIVVQPPVLNFSAPNLCEGTTVDISAQGISGSGYYNMYDSPTTTILLKSSFSDFLITANGSKTYYVSAFKTTCETTRTPITITATPYPTSTFTITPVCNQSAIITYTGTSLPTATYTWGFGGGAVISGNGAGPYTIRWTAGGTKSISLQVSQNGCISSTANQTFTVPAAPVPSFNVAATTCQSTISTALTGTPTGGVFSGTGISGSTYTPSTVGTNTITYSYTNPPDGCVYTAVKTVTVNPLPAVSISGLAAAYCQGDPAVVVTATPTGGAFSGTGISGSIFTPSSTGQRNIVYTYKDANNCSNTATQSVTVNPVPAVSFTGLAASYCQSSVPVALTGTPAGGTFIGTGISGNTFIPFTLGTNTITYNYTANGCGLPAVQSTTVTALLTPSVSITVSSASATCGQNVSFTAAPSNGGTVPQYQWKVNGLNITAATGAVYTTNALNTLDAVSCSMVSNQACYSTAPVLSNVLSVQVTPGTTAYYTTFDGVNDLVQIPAKTNYNVSGDFTIEAEISINPSATAMMPVLSRRTKTGSVADGFVLYENNGQLLFQLSNTNYYSDRYGNIRDNFLHKIAVTRQSGVLKFYLDATLIGTVNSSASMNSSALLTVGSDPYDLLFFKGTISNVHVWSVGKNPGDLYQTTIAATATGLLGNWKLNECAGQGIQDFSSFANHGVCGTSVNTESADPQRQPGSFAYSMQNALNLYATSNNAKHAEIPHIAAYDFSQNFTIEAIIQSANNFVSSAPGILSKRNSASDGFGFGISNGRIYVSIGGTVYWDNNTSGNNYNLYTYAGCNHVAIARKVVSGQGVYGIYINGYLTYTFINNSNVNTSAPIWIGNDKGTNNVFNAFIDEVRIWNITKTPSDIISNINTVFNTSTPNLIGYYRFQEESHAQWIKDESAVNNYGSMGSSLTAIDANDPARTIVSCYSNSRVADAPPAVQDYSVQTDTATAYAVLYPNPFETTVRLKIVNLQTTVDIQVMDAEGRLVYTKENHPATEELELGSDFAQGMYLVQFINQPQLKPIKFIKVF